MVSAAFFLPACLTADIDMDVIAFSRINADTTTVVLGQPAISGPFIIDLEIHGLATRMFGSPTRSPDFGTFAVGRDDFDAAKFGTELT